MKAVIDLGTNTFCLLIGTTEAPYKMIKRVELPVMLGQGGFASQHLTVEAMARGMHVLEQFNAIIRSNGVEQVIAFGTAAMRKASNGQTFVQAITSRFGFNVQIIDGEAEAAYIYEGARHAFAWAGKKALVMDIGGGSTELIYGTETDLEWAISLPLGASLLKESLNCDTPLSVVQTNRLVTYIRSFLDELPDVQPDLLIGTAGSFDTMKEVIRHDMKLPIRQINNHAWHIPNEAAHRWIHDIIVADEALLDRMQGIPEFRRKVIGIAAVLIRCVLDRYNPEQIVVSDYALKEGIFFSNT